MDRTPSAFAQAIAAQVPRLRRYATALSGNVATADDLVQDCVERALSREGTLRDAARLGAWLRTILYSIYISTIRERQRRGIAVTVDDLADDLALTAPSGDEGAVRDLVRAMAALSPDHRQILVLVGVEGMSYREVAELLDVPVGTVMSRLARARERLRAALDGDVDQGLRQVR
jgi:RNA polymerase sigma-70 factor (ECF subfamily)